MLARRILYVVLASALLAGCEKDPFDPQTWIDKLDSREDQAEAVRTLERLKDARAIKPLGAAWQKNGRPSTMLRAMINIANGGTILIEDEATGKGKRVAVPPNYKDVVPFLIEALENVNPGDRRSVDDGIVACDTLARAKDPAGIPILIATAKKPLPKLSEANHVRLAAIKALGSFNKPEVVKVLDEIVRGNPEKQLIRLNAAAALALAETKSTEALPSLVQAMFMGNIYRQVRPGIVAAGPPARLALMELFQHKNSLVEAYAKEKHFESTEPGGQPGNIEYKAALLLGDLRATEAVPMLTAALKTPNKPSYIDEKTGNPGPGFHEGILDTLRRIADPSAAPTVKEYFFNPANDDMVKPIAIDVYSFLADDPKLLVDLGKIVNTEETDLSIKFSSILVFGRLSHSEADFKPLLDYKKTLQEKIKKEEAKIAKPKDENEKIYAENYKMLYEDVIKNIDQAEVRAKVGYACKSDPACYAKYVADIKEDSTDEQVAGAERSLIELTRMGEKATGVYEQLLPVLETRNRFVREGLLIALPRIAPKNCPKCTARFEEVLDKQAKETTLDLLNEETRVIYYYFLNNSGPVPKAAEAEKKTL